MHAAVRRQTVLRHDPPAAVDARRAEAAVIAEAYRSAHRGMGTAAPGGPDGPIPSPKAPPATSAGGCAIKGNISRKGDRIYHMPGTRDYERTQINEASGERMFCSEDEAKAAGWRAPRG